MNRSFGHFNETVGWWFASAEALSDQKHIAEETLKLTVPAHRPIKRSTLAHVLKQARLDVARFLELV